MAKEQGLSLNPTQISGVCGRLMCCLKNEQEAYEELNRSLPSIGSQVKTIDGYTGDVQSTNVLKQLVKVVITKKNGEREIREYPVSDLSFKDHQISNEGSELDASLNEMVDAKGLEQLEIMERQDLEELQEEESEKAASKRENNRRSRNHRRDNKEQNREGRERNRESRDNRDRGRSRERNRDRDQNRDSRENRRDRNDRENRNNNRDREKRPSKNRGGYDNQNLHLPETEKQEQNFRGGYERQTDNRREKGRPERFREDRSRKKGNPSKRCTYEHRIKTRRTSG